MNLLNPLQGLWVQERSQRQWLRLAFDIVHCPVYAFSNDC